MIARCHSMGAAIFLTIAANIFFCSVIADAHSIHISYARGEARAGQLHVRVTYFKDDVLAAICKWNGFTPSNNDAWTAAKTGYVRGMWHATSNGADLDQIITASGEDPTSLWFEFDFRGSAPVQTMAVTHRALFAQFSDQANVFTVQTSSGEQSAMMNSGNPTCEIHL